MAVVGKRARVKSWIAGQENGSTGQIESFSDFAAPAGQPDDSSDDEDDIHVNGVKQNGVNGGDEDAADTVAVDPAQDWDAFEDFASRSIGSSSTNSRVHFLSDVMARLLRKNVFTPQQSAALLRLLIPTYSVYVDAKSREASLAALDSLFRSDLVQSDGKLCGKALVFLDSEVKGKVDSAAGSTVFGLLSWSVTLASCYASHYEASVLTNNAQIWPTLVRILALAYDGLLCAKVKPSIKKAGSVLLRRLVRKNASLIPPLLRDLSGPVSTIKPEPRKAALLGVVISVALRLKHRKGLADGQGLQWVQDTKEAIMSYFKDNILASRTALPPHTLIAFNDFVGVCVNEEDLFPSSELVKTMERALLRNPEFSLTAIDVFFTAYVSPPMPLAEISASQRAPGHELIRTKMLPSIMSSAKSANALTRSSAALLLNTLMQPYFRGNASDAEFVLSIARDIGNILKTAKTISPEHRATLYQTLSTLINGSDANTLAYMSLYEEVADVVAVTMAKETNESTLKVALELCCAATSHLLAADHDAPSTLQILLVKGIQDTKANIRRLYLMAVGNLLWGFGSTTKSSFSSRKLAKDCLPPYSSILKNAMTAPAGTAVEGWIAVAAVLGPFSKLELSAAADNAATVKTLLTVTPKPSFLLSERNYKRISNVDDEVWLLRAFQAVFDFSEPIQRCTEDSSRGVAVAQPILHIAVNSASHANRARALTIITHLCGEESNNSHRIILDALLRQLAQDATAVQAEFENEKVTDRRAQSRKVIVAMARAGRYKPQILGDLLVVCHHEQIVAVKQQIWVELVISCGYDLGAYVKEHCSRLVAEVNTYAGVGDVQLAHAAYAAMATLAFVSPLLYMPLLVSEATALLDVGRLQFIGPTEIGILSTPDGQTFVDVLSINAKASSSSSKNKNAALDKWDAETRKAIEAKRGAGLAAKLSKSDQKLFDDQIRVEGETRRRVIAALAETRQGFRTIQSILTLQDDIVYPFVPQLLHAMLPAVSIPFASFYAQDAFRVFMKLFERCDPRLSEVRASLSLCTLKVHESPAVPDDFYTESLAALVTTILYRLRFQSEQYPFAPSTFALAFPLMRTCLMRGGLGLAVDDADGLMEQLSLCLDVLAFHVRNFADTAYPRLIVINTLTYSLLKYPSLARVASQALIDLGAAISKNSTSDEHAALLHSLLVDESTVRHACLQALVPLDLTDLEYSQELWVAIHDTDERNHQIAMDIWEENGLDLSRNVAANLLPLLGHQNSFVRGATARAIADAAAQQPQSIGTTLSLLDAAYISSAKEVLPEYDQFGMLVHASLDQEDPWKTRVAQAEALRNMAHLWGPAEVVTLFEMLIDGGALGDRVEAVRTRMLEVGTHAIDAQGKPNLQPLMDRFQTYLAKTHPPNDVGDRITETVIVLFGRLAQHLDSGDERVQGVLDRLLEALKTPSEMVQIAVAECLPALMKANPNRSDKVIEQLLRQTTASVSYAERRGAAYGLAGAVKGRGISAVKDLEIIQRLEDATEEKKNANARQGAIFAFETLSSNLGRLFEPYIVKILPLLLACFGDSSADVREATSDAAKVIMSRLSGHAVKLILPILLNSLNDRQWRTKKGAIELMGSMAYLAPRQLSHFLPTLLPLLTETLTDTHAQVRAAANASLKRFGEVIDNPEIKALQSTLLGALVDPTKRTGKALDSLLKTSFVHYIDASSLALIIPIIERALRERATELKRKGAQIVGNMASLTESKDLIYYLPQLIPRVREVLVDPVPEARATAAKSLGVLIERLGEDAFPTMVEDLMRVLKSDMSGVDQQGAAQGLAEVLSGLGVDRMESMLPDIISFTASARSYVREGFISLLVYLPSVFGERFSPYLNRIIQPILSGLADDSEYVREASMRAGRMIVANHSHKAIDLLLPELETGLFDPRWRIRLSSIQLVGELLFRISGISGKSDMEEEVNEDEDSYTNNAEAAKKMLEVLGKERRDRVLAAIYIMRQDFAGQVRMFSLTVWKTLVSNTPRTVRDMLAALMQIIIRLLSADGEEQRETAARTLGELCRKQGDRILGDIIPILQQASSGSAVTRQGCCLAFAEMLATTSATQLEGYEDAIINSVRAALVDENASVRQAAAQAFDALQTQLGAQAIDQTIPTLLVALTQGGGASGAALSALRELMAVRSQAIFPILIPALIAQPISAFNAKSLASLVVVAGDALNRRLSLILDALQQSRDQETDENTRSELDNAIRAVLSSVRDVDGLHQLMLHLLALAKDPRAGKRIGGCRLFATFCEVSEEDASAYDIDWIRQLLALAEDDVPEVNEAAGDAMAALAKTFTKEQMENLSVPLRRTIDNLGPPGREIAGFCRPGGLKPILIILIQGLLAGTNEQREQSAFGLGDVVERTAIDALKPYVTQITGPLIRIIAERYPPPVKAAILSTLTILLVRVPQFVRPFFPQLQRTFVKNLAEVASSVVRSKAATGLGALMLHQPRIDPLITELVNGTSHDESDIRDAMSAALANVVQAGGPNMSVSSREAVADVVRRALEEPGKDNYNNSIARVLAYLLMHEIPHAKPLVLSVYEGSSTNISSTTLTICLEIAPSQLYKLSPVTPTAVVNRILKSVVNEQPGIARPAREARELLKNSMPWSDDEQVQSRLA